MKIAFVVSKFPFLRETFIFREIEELERRRIPVVVYSLKNLNKTERIQPEVIKFMKYARHSPFFISCAVWRCNLSILVRHPLKYLCWLLWLIFKLWLVPSRLLKTLISFPKIIYYAEKMAEIGITRIHAHWANIPATAAMIIADFINIPFSLTCRAFDIYEQENRPLLCDKIRRATHTITISEYNRDLIFQLTGQKENVEVIYNGIRLSDFPFTPYTNRKDFIVAIGAIEPRKGFDILVRSFNYIKDTIGKELPLFIIGDGPDRDSLEQLILLLNLEKVKILGWLPHNKVSAWLSDARFLVVSSRIEGLPKAVAEAYATGCPVVSFDLTGIHEIVIPGRTGWLVPPDNISALGEGIVEAWNKKDVCAQYGLAGRKLVEEKFDIEKNCSRFIDLIL